ncbi:hypothetical protein K2173_004311 [Erythroxylum novogranatense]|uniref:Secreted protein n=1 Tax=Erythroxylum novogranatense TaxID=1862640 RepID=A0AAV8U2I1_9ROSI|nr:hypothetical protein K2173_004311 [Erythroxylum novogranatense]
MFDHWFYLLLLCCCISGSSDSSFLVLIALSFLVNEIDPEQSYTESPIIFCPSPDLPLQDHSSTFCNENEALSAISMKFESFHVAIDEVMCSTPLS